MAGMSRYIVPTNSDGTRIERGRCVFCNVVDCAGFFADGHDCSNCLCSHHWHSHHPIGEELKELEARFQRGPCQNSGCAGFFPVECIPEPSATCLCSARINQHETKGLPAVHVVQYATANRDPSSHITTSEASSGPSWRAIVLPSASTSMNAAQRRTTDARRTFHEQTQLTARAHAPQTLSGLLPATTAFSGARLGVPNAPTTRPVSFHPSAGIQAPRSRGVPPFTFLVIPITLTGVDREGTAFPTPQKLDTRWDEFVEHLSTNALKVPYYPHRQELSGRALLLDIHRDLTAALARAEYSAYTLFDLSVPLLSLEVDHFPWQFVAYSTRTRDHMRITPIEIDLQDFTLRTLRTTPFGKGRTRPSIADSPANQSIVILIMQRYHDLLGSIPSIYKDRRPLQQWDEEQEESTILHKCMGRRIMNGFYRDDTPSNPAEFLCWSACGVRLEGREILPVMDNHGAPLEGSLGLGSPPGASSHLPSTPEPLNVVTSPPLANLAQTRPRPLDFVPGPLNSGSVPPVAGSGAISLTGTSNAASTITPGDIFRSSTTFSGTAALILSSNAPSLPLLVTSPLGPLQSPPSRRRLRSTSSVESQRPTYRRRVEDIGNATDIVELSDTSEEDPSHTPLFPTSHHRTTQAVYTQVGDGNLVDGFVSAAMITSLFSKTVSLVARTEQVAASALFDAIHRMACIKFGCRRPVDSLDQSLYEWRPHEPTEVESLFKLEFSLFIGNPTQGTALGNGPLVATMRCLANLAVNDVAVFNPPNTAGYCTINYDDSDIADGSRAAILWTAGVIAALHILRTKVGPHPITPFLLYLSLEKNFNRLVNLDFVSSFDDGASRTFFPRLTEVQNRRTVGQRPYLEPLEDVHLVQQGRTIAHTETVEVGDDACRLRRLIVGMLGGILGVHGFVNKKHPHPDFSAFQDGFSQIGGWPAPSNLREFVGLLYNRRPTTPEDVNCRLTFQSTKDDSLAALEAIWERGIRDYICGTGIPSLSQWLETSVERVDFNHVAGRATQVLKAFTGSDLMPAEDDWNLRFRFAPGISSAFTKETHPSETYEMLQAVTFFEFHTCDGYAIIHLGNDVLKLISKCPELFEAVMHINFSLSDGFSDEIF